jgi:hypothetical protein
VADGDGSKSSHRPIGSICVLHILQRHSVSSTCHRLGSEGNSKTNCQVNPKAAVPYVLVGGWILGAFLLYLMSLLVLNQVCPWKKLLITAEFNGILPIESREKARAA